MKKILSVVLALMPFFAAAQDRIMVFSDPHVLASSLIDTTSQSFQEMREGEIKMFELSEPVFTALVDTAIKYHPSLVLIPGDLTKNSEAASHAAVVAQINRLQAAGIPTLLIPGNHDIGGATYAYTGPTKTSVPNMQDADWESTYSMVYNAVTAKDPASHSFAAEPLQGLTVIGMDGSNGSSGSGVLKPATLQFILAQADSAVAKGHTIIAMSHWQVVEHFDKKAKLESVSLFNDAEAIRDSLMAHGVRLVLTGHVHVNSISTWKDSTGLTTDSIVEISTGSPITYPCSYRWLTLSADRSTIAVSTEKIATVADKADLTSYSREWTRVNTYTMIPRLGPRMWNNVDEYKAKIVSEYSLLVKILCQFYGDLGAEIDNAFPSSDSAKIAMVQRHLGEAIVNMYLFHCEANENERPVIGDSIAEDIYAGMQNMMYEVIEQSDVLTCLSDIIMAMIQMKAETPIQSLIQDRTRIGKLNENCTDDLRPILHINAPQSFTAVETVKDVKTEKFLHDGHLYIRRGEQLYNANGMRL